MKSVPLKVGGVTVKRGQRRRLEIPVARLPTGTALSLPVTVLRGRKPGPTIWLSAALHGDEINGTEIIRRVVLQLDPKSLSGAVIAVPIVNVYGFIERSRYLPDRRDLNRSFPGSASGSLASRLANLFLKEVVSHCSHGIDFHTGARHRTNLAHLRADLADEEARRLVEAFGAPLIFNAKRIVGSLRAEAHRREIPILVFEAGEPLRFDERSIEMGVHGTLRVMAALGMVPETIAPPPPPTVEATRAVWLRATRSGILHLATSMGEVTRKGEVLARIANPFSGRRRILRAPFDGLVFAQSTNPLVYQGDAILHLARIRGGVEASAIVSLSNGTREVRPRPKKKAKAKAKRGAKPAATAEKASGSKRPAGRSTTGAAKEGGKASASKKPASKKPTSKKPVSKKPASKKSGSKKPGDKKAGNDKGGSPKTGSGAARASDASTVDEAS